jgi:CheY-like chemotaxis protein
MARVFYVHWNKEEALATVRALRERGYAVVCHFSTEEGAGAEAWRAIKERPPDALVVSLERLPSHGRRVAAVVHETKRLREVPVIFVGGAPDKVDRARQEFPDARFTTQGRLPAALDQLGRGGRRRSPRRDTSRSLERPGPR